MIITPIEINKAYHKLISTQEVLYEVAERELEVKYNLETAVGEAVLAGEINGKNTQQREAQTRERFSDLHDDLDVAQYKTRYAKHQLDLAKLEVERVRLLVRLRELAKREVL